MIRDIFRYRKAKEMFYGWADACRLKQALKHGREFEVTYADPYISDKARIKIIMKWAHENYWNFRVETMPVYMEDALANPMDPMRYRCLHIVLVRGYNWFSLPELRSKLEGMGVHSKYVIYVPVQPEDVPIMGANCEILKME